LTSLSSNKNACIGYPLHPLWNANEEGQVQAKRGIEDNEFVMNSRRRVDSDKGNLYGAERLASIQINIRHNVCMKNEE
jgi:hypothetical protein